MSNWRAGYAEGISYPAYYQAELNPLRVKLALLNAGYAPPQIETACELGFGKGLSINIHAAASDVQWWGTDFDPENVSFAHTLASWSGSGATLRDDAFKEFFNRSDLPDFDYICLHGIWSWVNDENRSAIVDFLKRKLRIGGVLYLSYNAQPGWADLSQIQHLLAEHDSSMGGSSTTVAERLTAALGFAEGLLAASPSFLRELPGVAGKLKALKDLDPAYLAHEYFNRNWQAMHFASVAKWLEPAKLQFVCSARHVDDIDGLQITEQQAKFLKGIPDPYFRETARDYMIGQKFRRDLWIKGGRRLSSLDRHEALREQQVVLVNEPKDVARSIKTNLGSLTLHENIHSRALEVLADHRPKKLCELEASVGQKGVGFSQLLETILIWTSPGTVGGHQTVGHVNLAQNDTVAKSASRTTKALNHHLMQLSRGSAEISYLASPLTGGGIPLGRAEQLFLQDFHRGRKEPRQWAEAMWNVLESQGERINKDGRVLESAEENLAEITRWAIVFEKKYLPILSALGIS